MTIEQLKSRAYDLLRNIEFCQRELGAVNAEIVKMEQEDQNTQPKAKKDS